MGVFLAERVSLEECFTGVDAVRERVMRPIAIPHAKSEPQLVLEQVAEESGQALRGRPFKGERTSHLFDDILRLVIGEVIATPQLLGGGDGTLQIL